MSVINNNHELTQKTENSGREAQNKLKRIIIFSFAGMVLFVILFFWGASLLSNINESGGESLNNNAAYNPTQQTIIFCTPDYEENIYKDAVYMSLDRNIYISDIDTGLTESLEKGDYSNYSEAVSFIADFISTIISGDAEAYNKCFADEYYYDNDEKESFTMQKLYNITITKMSETETDAGYFEYVYTLEYMIRQNNGTFRTDMGSDALKKQYVTITDKSGSLLIDEISNVSIN